VAAPAAAGAALLAISRGEEVDYDQLSQQAGDDLTLLEGIGPKIQDLLYQNGIHTYSELAESDVERLRAILLAGGGAFRMADPTTWPQQARLAAAKDWTRLQALNERLKGGVKRPVAKPAPQPDDLTILEGVGPKIQELLYQNGIHTYAELSVCDVEQLKAILDGGGPAFRMADPTTWPQQARLAAAHDWTRLQTLNERLRGGVKRPAEPPREDDLTIIEGIGPKVADCLKEHGIHTFAQLARTDVDRLHAILGDAGPAFKLAAPAVDCWPKQARLAADGAWDELHALRDALKAGRADDAG
jgi:predicted flap endonuclease-1-like 5' DNA nuclease